MKPGPSVSVSSWDDLAPSERAAIKIACREDHLAFTKVFFRELQGTAFRVGPHHRVMGRVLDRVIGGEINRLIISVPPGYTKAIDCDTPMWTPQGWRSAREIRLGDKLLGSNGQWTSVIGIAPQGVKPAYRVLFSDRTQIVACADHRWAVRLRDKVDERGWEAPWQVKTTAELIGNLRESDGRKKWRIPVVAPKFDDARSVLPIDPYLLGCWLGDGHTYQAAITTMDDEIVQAFRDAGYDVKPQRVQNAGRVTTYSVNNGLHRQLRLLGLLGRKFIPDCYLQASSADRLALLQGLCDTDGGIHRTNGQQSVSSCNDALADQIKFLICSVGGVYRCHSSPAANKVSHRLGITMPLGLDAFRLSRKSALINARREHNTPRRFIDAIEPVEAREMVCFAVDADDHLFCAGRDLIVTHNTEAAVVAFIARGLAINPKAKFIHASFSGELVNENSVRVKDVMASAPFQDMWPIAFKDDQSAKGLWRTDQGGGLLAKPAGGPITGFRAGTMDEGFTGALVIDDPLKPDDAFSNTEREKINRRWHSTFKSRLAREDVPVIVIMQRLHADDFAGYLLRGGADCQWHHLMLPARVEADAAYPAEFTHGIPIEHGLPAGPLWPEKHNESHLKILEADAYTFASQYMQRPIALGGNLFKSDWLVPYKSAELPPMEWRAIFADTAQKVGIKNDFTVFQVWGKGRDGLAYLINQVRGKWEAPELLTTARVLWETELGRSPLTYGALRYFGVEDKVSGTGLIQQLGRERVPVTAIVRGGDKDKYTRAMDVVPYFANRLVRVPADAPWYGDWMYEILQFTGQGDAHDDQVDPTVDAVKDILAGGLSYAGWV